MNLINLRSTGALIYLSCGRSQTGRFLSFSDFTSTSANQLLHIHHTHTHTRKRSMFSSNSRRESEWADFPECHIYFFPRHILEVLTFPASHTEHIPVGTVWTLCSWAACFSHGRSVAWWSHSPSWKGCGDEQWSGWRCLVHSLKEWQNEKKGGKQGCYSCHVQLIQVFHLVRVFRMKKRGRPNELFKKKPTHSFYILRLFRDSPSERCSQFQSPSEKSFAQTRTIEADVLLSEPVPTASQHTAMISLLVTSAW